MLDIDLKGYYSAPYLRASWSNSAATLKCGKVALMTVLVSVRELKMHQPHAKCVVFSSGKNEGSCCLPNVSMDAQKQSAERCLILNSSHFTGYLSFIVWTCTSRGGHCGNSQGRKQHQVVVLLQQQHHLSNTQILNSLTYCSACKLGRGRRRRRSSGGSAKEAFSPPPLPP